MKLYRGTVPCFILLFDLCLLIVIGLIFVFVPCIYSWLCLVFVLFEVFVCDLKYLYIMNDVYEYELYATVLHILIS